jgi:hypothetical protein
MNRSPGEDAGATEPPTDDSRPGRVEVDSRGNSVWRWARNVLDTTSVLLKRLENKDLALEPTRKVPVLGGKAAASAARSAGRGSQDAASPTQSRSRSGAKPAPGGTSRDGGGGFDPYNSR